jgi:hypothetical protein
LLEQLALPFFMLLPVRSVRIAAGLAEIALQLVSAVMQAVVQCRRK